MAEDRIERIRRAEAFSHTQAYEKLELFEPGSWLSKPVKTVMELLPYFENGNAFVGLDLGCGVGRNCIPVLRELSHIPARMDCVDILPLAIEKLLENARKHEVEACINGIVSAADHFSIPEERYDLILGISVLEHLNGSEALSEMLRRIRDGLRPDGIACFVINTSIEEHDKRTDEPRNVQFEINMRTCEMESMLEEAFSSFEILKHSVIHYQYDTFRESGVVRLDTDVLTWVGRKGANHG